MRFRLLRADLVAVDDRLCLRDDVRAHMRAFLDQVDPKRQTITDEQLSDAIIPSDAIR